MRRTPPAIFLRHRPTCELLPLLNDDSRRFKLKSYEARGSVFELRRRHSSNAEPSNINENNLVAPTGFDHDASAFELEFEGLALTA